MRELAQQLNESKRDAESFAEVIRVYGQIVPKEGEVKNLIQPHRRFIKEVRFLHPKQDPVDFFNHFSTLLQGSLIYFNDDGKEEALYLFMFNDVLLITQAETVLHYRVLIYVNFSSVTNVLTMQDSDYVKNSFLIDTPKKSMLMFAESAEER